MLSSLTIGGLAKALGPLLLGASPARRAYPPPLRVEPIVDLVQLEPPAPDPLPAPCEIADPGRLVEGRRLIDCTEREFSAARLLGRHKRVLAMPLAPAEAARQFVAWMQDLGRVGWRPWRGDEGVWSYYLAHCAEADLQPIPDQLLANALAQIAPKKLVRDRSSGEMERITLYDLPAAPLAPAQPKRHQAKPPKTGARASAQRLPQRMPTRRAA